MVVGPVRAGRSLGLEVCLYTRLLCLIPWLSEGDVFTQSKLFKIKYWWNANEPLKTHTCSTPEIQGSIKGLIRF